MPWRWIAVLGVVSSVWAQGQQQGQAGAPAATASTESEISTRGMDTAIKVQVNLVLVRVVVRDTGGMVVPGLKQKDFQVLDNGKRQRISTFSVETAETGGNGGAATVERKPAGAETGRGAEGEAGGVANAPAMPQRFVALVFDDLHMKAADATAVRAATKKLFASLSPTDRVAIYSTTPGNAQQDFTGDAETLRKTLAAIIPHPGKGEGQYECPNISYYQADLIVNKHDLDAILAADVDAQVNDCPVNIRATAERILQAGDLVTRESNEYLENIVKHLAGMPGQRVLVYVSPGFVLGDAVLPTSWELIERAMRAGVVVNTVDARGLYTADVMPEISAPPQVAPYKGDPTADYKGMEGTFRMQTQFQSGQVLAEMASNTGGTYFHNRNDLNVAMSQALAAPNVSYVLGFTPQNSVDGKFHHLKVTLANGKKYQIQARNGYYASKMSVDDPEELARQKVREALFSQDEMVSVPVKLKEEFLKLDPTSAQLTVLTQLEISGARFRKAGGRSCDEFVLATGVFDANGQFVGGQMKEISLKLTDSTLERMSQTGLTFKTVFIVKPGTYRVRSVVRGSEGDQLTARNLMTMIPSKQSNESEKKVSGQNSQWAPPTVDANLKSLSMIPPCDLSQVLEHTAENSLALASNLEKLTARERIEYVMLDRNGMVEKFDSGSFNYVYWIEQQSNGSVSREYRTPAKGSHAFRESEQDTGQAAIASIFQPDLQTDYEMKCEGMDERNGQPDWVVHFQQRKDRPTRTANFSVDNAVHPAMLKGRAWISQENFQVVHLEASLMGDLPEIGLQELAFSVDYEFVRSPSGSLGLWLPNSIVTYRDYDAHRIILAHSFADFQFFAVEIKEKIQEPKEP